MRTSVVRAALCSVLSSLMLVAAGLGGLAAVAQENKEKPAKARTRDAEAKKAKGPRGRLPAYYSQVVDQKQREAIYKIQEEYEPKIAALREQLDALTKQRDEKVAAVLTPEQLKKIAELQAAGKAKRAQPKPEEKKPAKEPPAKKPAGKAEEK